jgi:hypothetical protein
VIKPQDVQFNEHVEALVDPGNGVLRIASVMLRNAITRLDNDHDADCMKTIEAQILLHRCELILHAETEVIFRARRTHFERTGSFTLGKVTKP